MVWLKLEEFGPSEPKMIKLDDCADGLEDFINIQFRRAKYFTLIMYLYSIDDV